MAVQKLTPDDVKKIQAEIDRRILVDRPRLIQAVKEARAQGDLSENFEYYAAKREKNHNESRINYLQRLLRSAVIIEDHSRADEVGLNDSVTVWMEEDEMEDTFRIVTNIRADSLQNKISTESPLGRALRGHKAGDRVYVKISDTAGYYLVIRKIEKTADESADEISPY